MSKLLLLLKVDLFRTLSLNKLTTNKNVIKTVGMVILGLFLISTLFISAGA